MPAQSWSVISCPDCHAKLKVPADLQEGESVACPSCGVKMEGTEPDTAPSPPKEPRPEPAEIANEETAPAPLEEAAPSAGVLPPPPKRGVDLDLSGIAVRDANRKPLSTADSVASPPKLERFEKLASTDDEALQSTESDTPRQRVSSSRARREIVGWDAVDEGESEVRKSTQSTVAGTFRLALLALPVVIAVVVFALNVRGGPPKSGSVYEDAETADDASSDAAEAEPPAPAPIAADSLDAMFYELEGAEFQKRVHETVTAFLETKTIDERLALARHPERVRPLMERYYSTHPISLSGNKINQTNPQVTLQDGYVVTMVQVDDFEFRPIVLARRGEKIVVDWESFVGYCEIPVAEFREKKPTTPLLFRLRATPDDYYNYGFDEKTYHCLSLRNLDGTESFYGYAKRKSPLAAKMLNRMSNQRGIDFVILKLRFPADAQADNQAIIDDFIDIGWLIKEQK